VPGLSVATGTVIALMRSTVEPLEGNKVKLSIEVEGAEFEKEVDAAFRRIAHEVRLPGFRPGKAPRRLLEARIGSEAARGDALEHALPTYYADAVEEHEVDVIAAPEIDITSGREEGDIVFDAVVEVRPEVNLGGYDSLRVTIDSPDVDPSEVDAQIDRLREAQAELREVERPAQTGDSVTIDIAGYQDGEPLAGLTADGYLYEVGSATIVPELDKHLDGAEMGDALEFTADHPDPEEDAVTFEVAVKAIKEKILPEPDDAFAAEASEFSSLEELRADITRRMGTMKKVQARNQLRQKTAETLADLVEQDAPEALVNTEMQARLEDLAMRLQAQGLGLEQYISAMGDEQDSFVANMRHAAAQGVKVDLALRAVATAEGIEVSDEDLEAEYASVAERVGQKPSQVRKQLEHNGQVAAIRSDLRTRMALEWLIEHVELVDEGGNVIDRDSLETEPEPTTDDGTDANGEEATKDDE